MNDKKEMELAVAGVDEEVREINTICMDSGFYSEEAVAAVEKINKKGCTGSWKGNGWLNAWYNGENMTNVHTFFGFN